MNVTYSKHCYQWYVFEIRMECYQDSKIGGSVLRADPVSVHSAHLISVDTDDHMHDVVL